MGRLRHPNPSSYCLSLHNHTTVHVSKSNSFSPQPFTQLAIEYSLKMFFLFVESLTLACYNFTSIEMSLFRLFCHFSPIAVFLFRSPSSHLFPFTFLFRSSSSSFSCILPFCDYFDSVPHIALPDLPKPYILTSSSFAFISALFSRAISVDMSS